MTITQDSSAPLVVVCGATGIQGGSVVKALSESDRAYRLRGLTRDPTKPSAVQLTKQGVEVVRVSLDVGNESAVRKAFEGANIAFVMTNFWEFMNAQKETDQGIMLVKTAQAVGVDLLVWSGLESVTKSSGGKYTLAEHFDGKAEVTAFAQKSGVPFVNVEAGFYASNFALSLKPVKQADGSYVVAVPFNPDAPVPLIDMVHDFGLFVREAIESPAFGPGTEIFSYGELISINDITSQLAEFTGKKISCVKITSEQYIEAFFAPRSVALDVLDGFHFLEEFGYYGPKDLKPSHQHLARKPRTWADYVKATNWASILD